MSVFRALARSWPRAGTYRGEVAESFVANVVLSGVTFLSGILLARLLGPQGRGELLAIQALPLLIGTFGMFGIQDAMIYHGARAPQRIGDYAISSATLIALLGVPVVAVAAVVTPHFLRAQSASVIHASQIYLGLLFVHAATSLSTVAARAAHHITLWNRLRIVPVLIWLTVILVLHRLGRLEPARLALIYLFCFFVWCLVSVVPARRYYRDGARLCPALWRPLLRYGLPVASGGAPRILNYRVDQVIIAGMFAAEDLGYYGMAVAWAALMDLPANALANVAFSRVASTVEPAVQRSFARRSFAWMVLITLVAGVLIAAAAPLAIPLVFGRDFAAAVPLALILIIGSALRGLSQMGQNLMMGMNRPSIVLYSEWVGFALLAALLALLAPRYGLRGVAWATVVSSAGTLIVTLLLKRSWLAESGDRR